MIKRFLISFPFAQIYIILFDNKIKNYIVTFLVDMIEISFSFSFISFLSYLALEKPVVAFFFS